MSLDQQGSIPKHTVSNDDAAHDADPFTDLAVRPRVLVSFEHSGAADLALGLEVAGVHALIRIAELLAVPDRISELGDHHALEHVGLIIDVVEDVWEGKCQLPT